MAQETRKEVRKGRIFKATDEEWKQIQELAEKAGMSASEYIRSRSLMDINKTLSQVKKAITEFQEAVSKISI